MKKSFRFLMVIGVVWMTLGGCMRNDDEPAVPVRPIARLYVSIGNFSTDTSSVPFDNVLLIDPADTTELEVALSHDSGVLRGGSAIHFDPFNSAVFQAGYGSSDTAIRVMTVGSLGILSNKGEIRYRGLNAMRGIAYHHSSKYLYVTNNATGTSDGRTTIYGYHLPMNRNGYTPPHRVLRLDPTVRPWGMALWGDSLLVANQAASGGGVVLYGNLSQVDSLAANFQALSTIRIQGATSIRGIAFVDSLDVLVAADYGTGSSDNPVTDGRIYIIEGIKAQLANVSATIVPTQTIQGSQTGLTGPMDVAIDPRQGKRTIFVSDYDYQGNGYTGRIARFRLSDDGNVAPEAVISLDTLGTVRRPFGLFLDVRGIANSQ